jgi:Kdo2-lipid IVA lauroyltransferase/acyltransferase
MMRIGLAILWLLHLLPLAVLAPLGRGIGCLLYPLARERRNVTLINLRLCFPQWSEAERKRVARRHFQSVARAFLEHGILWWASKERIQKFVRVEGIEHWQAVAGKPVIWLAPHFVGLDMGGTRIISEWKGVSIYSKQKNAAFDRVLLHGRTRFVAPVLFSRQDGIRPVVKAMRSGLPLYYLPLRARRGVRAVFQHPRGHHHRPHAHGASRARSGGARGDAPVAGCCGIRTAFLSGVGELSERRSRGRYTPHERLYRRKGA